MVFDDFQRGPLVERREPYITTVIVAERRLLKEREEKRRLLKVSKEAWVSYEGSGRLQGLRKKITVFEFDNFSLRDLGLVMLA